MKPVDISIKPDAAPPVRINARSNGTIPVAILSTPTFDAPTSVDTSTLTFGQTGNEQSLAFCNTGGEDVNNDGLLDLACHFQTQLAGFQSGDALAILKGKTVQGGPIVGQEADRNGAVAGCEWGRYWTNRYAALLPTPCRRAKSTSRTFWDLGFGILGFGISQSPMCPERTESGWRALQDSSTGSPSEARREVS